MVALLAGIWSVRRPRMNSAVVPALITGVFIGIYTTLDRVGINLGSPWLYGGLLWLFIAVLLAAWTRGRPLRPRALRAASNGMDRPFTTSSAWCTSTRSTGARP